MDDLFDWQKSRRRGGPSTSDDAAMEAGKLAARHHALILATLRERGCALAAEQIGDANNVGHVAINRRLTELERAGLIIKTKSKHTNRSGRGAFQYALVSSR